MVVIAMPRRVFARPWASLLELGCRAGYAARGLVYVSVGFIALLAALDFTPRSRGMIEAMEAWADWPLGMVLLWLTGLGLYGFAGWRLLQSVLDADRQGRKPKALAARTLQAVSGLIYVALAISVFGLIDALEDLREVEDQAKTREAIQTALGMPGGEWLVAIVGAFIFGTGIGGFVQAVRRDYCKRLTCGERFGRVAALLGRAGYASRGLVFLTAGSFMIMAGVNASSGQVQGTGGALNWLEARPFGGPMLAIIAAGLIAFGLFAFVEARFRALHVERVVDA